jgi:hypothetical protein
VSGQHHRRVGWTYGPRPRGTCRGCQESKVVGNNGLIVRHRQRVAGQLTLHGCPGGGQPAAEQHQPNQGHEHGPDCVRYGCPNPRDWADTR